ncbi:TonB-dependent receptor domain-containing protein [Helicobacter pametensis]|uniref:TonB-dependent receptor domain-containing protein n=1 Tax=Helicobacter pametensis TaxID=95149 RepID=UPI0006851718|nr:TonB-dependent receptor [Helicobacter pametensis]
MKKYLAFFALGVCASVAKEVELDEVRVNSTHYRLDDLNRNVYFIDSQSIAQKGFSSMEQVFASLPFVGMSNFGLGQNIDLRGQGRSANVNTQILFNGIGLNVLDSSHGVTPIQSIGIGEVESIEILPGGGAVMYGNGTRGGVVNITSKKRYEVLSANMGGGYSYSNGSGAKVDAKIGGKVGDGLYLSFGGNYVFSQGYRQKDLSHLGGVNGNVTWDINNQHSLSLDLGYFLGEDQTSPMIRFGEDSHPSKSDRTRAGRGEIITLQERISTALNYDYQINSDHKITFKTYFQRYQSKYKTNLQVMDYPIEMMNLLLKDTQVDQKGSLFLDSKIGFQARYDWKHTNGLLVIGFDSLYQQGERELKLDIDWKGNLNFPFPPMNVTSYEHLINTYVNAKKWSNSLYVLERYDFSSSFSLTAGGRYEFAWYGGYRTYDNDMKIGATPVSPRPIPPIQYSLYKDISNTTHNFALELTPRYVFEIGDVYGKYERGFRSPNPDNLTARNGSGSSNNYVDTHIKSETYDTFELGSKLFVGEHAMFLLTGFYTLTHDEIYTLGSAHTIGGFKVGNYKLTQRAGVELASEQNFLDGIIGLSESFSYVDARILNAGSSGVKNGSLIPYVSNYKATLGVNYRFYKGWNLWVMSSFVGSQRDTAQNYIPAYNLTDIGMDFTHKNFSLSFGVRNVADTFYYSYYNKDSSDPVTGYAFLIGEGRSYFIEGRYKF